MFKDSPLATTPRPPVAEPSRPKPGGNLAWTDGARALLALTVIVYHAVLTRLPDGLEGSGQIALQLLAVTAQAAVMVFVMLSGYLLGRHWRTAPDGRAGAAEIKTFMKRRCWRLLPTYWFATTVTIVLMLCIGLRHAEGTHWDTGLPLTWGRAIMDYLLLSDVFRQVPLTHPLWTVPVEFHLYLLSPLIALIPRRAGALAFATISTALLIFLVSDFHAPFLLFSYICAFWCGRQTRIAPDGALGRTALFVLPFTAVSFALVVVAATVQPITGSTLNYFIADGLIWSAVLWWLLRRDLQPAPRAIDIRILTLRPIQWIGERSFSLYLIHAVALEVLWRFAIRPLDLSVAWDVVTLIVVGTAVSLALTAVMFPYIEKPTVRRARTAGSQRRRTEETA